MLRAAELHTLHDWPQRTIKDVFGFRSVGPARGTQQEALRDGADVRRAGYLLREHYARMVNVKTAAGARALLRRIHRALLSGDEAARVKALLDCAYLLEDVGVCADAEEKGGDRVS